MNTSQSCSCMWQLKSNIPEFPSLDLTFTMDYCCLSGEDQIKRSLPYTFGFNNYQVCYCFCYLQELHFELVTLSLSLSSLFLSVWDIGNWSVFIPYKEYRVLVVPGKRHPGTIGMPINCRCNNARILQSC